MKFSEITIACQTGLKAADAACQVLKNNEATSKKKNVFSAINALATNLKHLGISINNQLGDGKNKKYTPFIMGETGALALGFPGVLIPQVKDFCLSPPALDFIEDETGLHIPLCAKFRTLNKQTKGLYVDAMAEIMKL